MPVLDDLLNLLPLAGANPLAPEERNVLRVPAALPATIQPGPLRADAGAPTDATPRRVVVIVGPGATLKGIAGLVQEVYAQALKAGAPTVDQMAPALVKYNETRLAGGFQVGMVLPLPIEIDPGSGNWTVSATLITTLAATPVTQARLTTPAQPLPIPDPFGLEAQAQARLATPVPTLAAQLWSELLGNPYQAVLMFFAVLRALAHRPGTGASDTALAALTGATPDQVALLAGTRAGNGLLRYLQRLLVARPGTPAAVLALLDNALHAGPAGHRTLVAHQDLPQTVTQLGERQRDAAKPEEGAAADPPGGLHRVVLGRDLAVGLGRPGRAAGTGYFGPAFDGRLALAPYLIADDAGLNPPSVASDVGDFRVNDLLTALSGEAGRGRLDAVQAGDLGLVSVGLDHWTVRDPAGVALLLLGFKNRSADEYDLFFGLYGLDVQSTGGTAQLVKVAPDGSRTVLDQSTLAAFFGGTRDPGGTVTFTAEWAARFRLPALVSLIYRRSQVFLTQLRLGGTVALPRVEALTQPFPVPWSLDHIAGGSYSVGPITRNLSDLTNYLQFYNAGTDHWELLGKVLIDHHKFDVDPADNTKFVIPTAMRISAPRDPANPAAVGGRGKLPVVLLVHGQHLAWKPVYGPPSAATHFVPGKGPKLVADTAASIDEAPSHNGYTLLQDALAAAGIISVSVNTNAANFLSGAAQDPGVDMRANILQAALDHLATLHTTAGSPYQGRLDLKRLGLMGHSRGGDGVVMLARRLRGSGTYTVKAVCALAPTDLTGTATDSTQLVLTPADTNFFLCLYGSLDGDVHGEGGAAALTGTGYRHYARATCAKAMVQLDRCGHNRFNSVWSGGTPAAPFAGDEAAITAADAPRLRSFGVHQKVEIEYIAGLFRWQLLGDTSARNLLRGERPNKPGVPGSVQWSFGTGLQPLDDFEQATPSLAGATRTLVKGTKVSFPGVTVPASTLIAGAPATTPLPITLHATHPSGVMVVDATVPPTADKRAMTLAVPAAGGDWHGYTWLTFGLSGTLDISTDAAYAASPLPRVALVLKDGGGRERRVADALTFTAGAPSRPEHHRINGSGDVTLFRFETVRVPLIEFAKAGGVDLAAVRLLTVEFDPANQTHVLYDSFQLVKG